MDIDRRVNELMGYRPRDPDEDPECTTLKSYIEIREAVKALVKEAILEERAKWVTATNECHVSSKLIVGQVIDFVQKEAFDYQDQEQLYAELLPFLKARYKVLDARRKKPTDSSVPTPE